MLYDVIVFIPEQQSSVFSFVNIDTSCMHQYVEYLDNKIMDKSDHRTFF